MIDSPSPRRIAVLLPAAGNGSRVGGAIPKQFRLLAGKPLIRWTVDALLRHPAITTIVPIIAPAYFDDCRTALTGLDRVAAPVAGGDGRQESVRAGLEALAEDEAPPDLVLIHDAARPFVTVPLIDRVINALSAETQALAAIPGVAVSDTMKRVDCGRVIGTVDRRGLYRAQTPQGFSFPAILAAHRATAHQALTDDAAVAEAAGVAVALVAGDDGNVKITTRDDLTRAETRLNGTLPDVRTGFGYDVHPLGPGDGVWLGGIKIPFSRSLVGHSDADVGLHALTDAILGAISAGDIGWHFPPSDPRWKGAASDRFLAHAADLVRERGGVIAHVDLTLICEVPKVSPHRMAIITRIADILGLLPDRVSVKATTTEKLGFTGRGEGIAAQAVATVRLP